MREELARHEVDFSDIASGQRLAAVHPRRILRKDFLEPLGLSVYRLAKDLKVPRPRLNDVVREKRPVTVDTALRLGCHFGTTAAFWLNLQTRYDLDTAGREARTAIDREVEPRAPFQPWSPSGIGPSPS